MVAIEENLNSAENLIQNYFSQLKQEILAESFKILTKELQEADPVKYDQIQTSKINLIKRIDKFEERCIEKHLLELKQNQLEFNKLNSKNLNYQDNILKAALGSEQLIFASLRFKDEENFRFGAVIKVNEFISRNGLQLIKREISKFNPFKTLTENVSGIFAGVQFKVLTMETLQIWFLLKKLYYFIQEQNASNIFYEIDLKEFYFVKEINFYFKNCQTFPAFAFNQSLVRVSSLKKLVLWGNHIKEIHPSAFSTLHNLEILNLDANKLEWVNPRWFDPLFNLKELYLSNNCLKAIPADSFRNLTKLEVLEIKGAHNDFKYQKDLFEGLESLKSLKLAGIHENNPEIFCNLTNLTSLELDNFFDKEKSFDYSYFNFLVNLKMFSLQNSSIGSLKKNFMTEQLQLERLSLSDCQIDKIDANAFSHLKELIQISLSGCGIDQIDKGTFRGLNKLTKIDLSFNKFKEGHIFGFDEHDESIIVNL